MKRIALIFLFMSLSASSVYADYYTFDLITNSNFTSCNSNSFDISGGKVIFTEGDGIHQYDIVSKTDQLIIPNELGFSMRGKMSVNQNP